VIKGTTESGFDFEVKEELADDFEFLELLGDFSENPLMASKLADKMLGREQKEALKEHLRGEDGRIKTSDMFRELTEIITAFPKN
jgi:hypothetical protein